MEIFVNVVRCGNFSSAAKKLYLSQPAISSSVDSLEKELGVKLFLRKGRKMVLTKKGEDFYEGSLDILNLTEQTIKNVTESTELRGTIRIASNHAGGIHYIPKILVEFRELYPDIYFDLYIKESIKVVKHVLENIFDIGIVGMPVENNYLKRKCVLSDKLVFTCLNKKPFSDIVPTLSFSELCDIPFISRTLDGERITAFEAALYEMGKSSLELNVVAEMNSNEAILAAVLSGLGMAVFPHSCIMKYPDLLEFEVAGMHMRHNYYAIMNNNDCVSKPATVFYEFMEERLENSGEGMQSHPTGAGK
jgi:DNA-binding transcriptional LysR family regulator